MNKRGLRLKHGFLLGLLLLVLFAVRPALSDTVQYIYDNLGRLVMTTSSNGTVIIYGYDDAGRLISNQSAGCRSIKMERFKASGCCGRKG